MSGSSMASGLQFQKVSFNGLKETDHNTKHFLKNTLPKIMKSKQNQSFQTTILPSVRPPFVFHHWLLERDRHNAEYSLGPAVISYTVFDMREVTVTRNTASQLRLVWVRVENWGGGTLERTS